MRAQMLGVALRGSAGGATVSLSDATVEDLDVAPNPASAWIELQSDGDLAFNPGTATKWLIGSVTGSNYECRATIVSGALSTGTTGSWLTLSATRRWTVNRSSVGQSSCTFLLEIGLSGQSLAVRSATITLTASVDI